MAGSGAAALVLVSEADRAERYAVMGAGKSHFIGRTTFASIADKRCSRKQLELVVEDDGSVQVTAHGLNPAGYYKGADTTLHFLKKGACVTLHAGDRVALLGDGTLCFSITHAPSPSPSDDHVAVASLPPEQKQASPRVKCNAQWSWLSENGYVLYSEAQNELIEAAFQAKKTQLDLDAERFIDLVENYQRRKDDPSKRRVVKREVMNPAATPSQKSKSSVTPKSGGIGGAIGRGAVGNIFDCIAFHFPAGQMPKHVVEEIERQGGHVCRVFTPAVTYVVLEADEVYKCADVIKTVTKSGASVVSHEFVTDSIAAGKVVDTGPYIIHPPKAGTTPPPPSAVAPAAVAPAAVAPAAVAPAAVAHATVAHATVAQAAVGVAAPPAPRYEAPRYDTPHHDPPRCEAPHHEAPPLRRAAFGLSSPAKPKVVWYWRSDDMWVPYDAKISGKVEAAFQTSGADSVTIVPIDKQRYIDLNDMKQKRRDNVNLERDIKRETE
eukprot:TRINITY_DN1331_c0_g1_i1.p1 TRINITY_DN1331_c0_g1~~TRINITY_DN1331_c0_g1_i1.p1  ORF type:complete len:494 (-),score=97.60 TRINITY_DN1331_c0_g1_i1:87-1568(-)